MRYGLIGEKLNYSFSKIIHEQLASYTFDLIPLSREEFPVFMEEKQFAAINVTIPYKEQVIPYLEEMDASAAAIGAVNTIVNRDGKLYGYNTDYSGFRYMLTHNNINPEGKKVLILGKGGASKACIAVVKDMGAKEVLTVYYKENPATITYEDCYQNHKDAHIIINTTPVGTFPNTNNSPIDLSPFTNLEAVVDIVYNPLRTKLVLDGLEKGIPSIGGLEMLIGQAKYAVEIFLQTSLPDSAIEKINNEMLAQRENIVLIGMSGCGKTTLGKELAKKLQKTFVDTDQKIVERIQMPISEYFQKFGEEAFRKIEKEVVQEYSLQNGLVLSTGGGVVKDCENITALKHNGKIIWVKRELEHLEFGQSRPLASSKEAVHTLYQERIPLYTKYAQAIAPNNGTIAEGVETIIKLFQQQ